MRVIKSEVSFPPTTTRCSMGCHVLYHKCVAAQGFVFYMGKCSHTVFYWVAAGCDKMSSSLVFLMSKFVPQSRRRVPK